jgi:pimeloyl-ACP methyl ester carboxylesterase
MPERIEVGALTLAYEERQPPGGSEEAVLFVHGLGGSLHSWWAQLAACEAAGRRAIAYDQRGAGQSAKPPGPYSVGLWVDDLERLIDGLGLRRVALVGQSVGCMIAEQAAVRLGARASGLALIGGGLRWREGSRPVFEERIRLAGAGRMDKIAAGVAETGLSERCRTENPALCGLFRAMIAGNDPACYAEWAAATAVAEMIEPERVGCPTLVACGELDPVAPPAFAEAIAAALPDARTRVIQGAAHWCQLEAPEAVNRALLEFLDEIAT